MAKDPAFLFYPGDFMQGTQTFTREEKGAYMDLLILQFNEGHLSIDLIRRCLNGDFDRMWPFLQKKFRADANGLFFNERLEIEIEKRRSYSQSRRDNRKSKDKSEHMNNISNTYVQHMENENENRNKDINDIRKGVQGKTIDEEIHDLVFMDEVWFSTLKMHFPGYDYDEVWSKCYAWHNNRPQPPNSAWQWREKLRNWLSRMDEKKYAGSTKTIKKRFKAEEL